MRNKKIIALSITCLLLFITVISNTSAKIVNKKRIIYVDCYYNNPKNLSDGSRTCPYTKIQQGINAANPGNTVFVFNGVYNENVIVNKSISLVGENKYSTIIHGYYEDEPYATVYITADWVYMSGFNIQPDIFSLILYYSNHSFIIGNNVLYNDIMSGLYLKYSNNNTISGNDVSGNIESGIHLIYSSYNTISDNKVIGNGDWGILLTLGSNYNIITGNNVNANSWANIYLSDSNNNIISDNNASNCSASSVRDIDNWLDKKNIKKPNLTKTSSSMNLIFYNIFYKEKFFL